MNKFTPTKWWRQLLRWFRRDWEIARLLLILMSLTLLLVIAGLGIQYGVRNVLALNQIQRAEAGLIQEKQQLLSFAEELSARTDFRRMLVKHDIAGMVRLLEKFQQDHQVGLVIGVDETGFTLARVPVSVGGTGDYLFQTTYAGRQVAQGIPYAVIAEGRTFPMVIAAGYPVKLDTQVVGGAFVGYSVNDDFISRFNNKYLARSVQTAFYTQAEGVVGSSFTDHTIQDWISAYFNAGSDWIHSGRSGAIVQVAGRTYWLTNLVLPALDEKSVSPGGVLVFIPLLPTWSAILLFIGLVVLVAGVGLYWLRRRRPRLWPIKRDHPYLWTAITIFTLTAVVGLAIISQLRINTTQKVMLRDAPFTIYNSTLTLWPDQDLIGVGATRRIAIRLHAGGEAINVVQAVLNYNPEIIMVKEIITEKSFCPPEAFLDKYIDNQLGEVSIVCGLSANHFSGNNGVVAEIIIQALAPGTFELRFGDDTQVLAADGLGTNVLRTVTDGSYRVVTGMPGGPITGQIPLSLFSASHANSERWSRNKEIHMSWPFGVGGDQFVYRLDRDTTSSPVGGTITTERRVIINAPADGIWYFHVAPIDVSGRVGVPAHYKIQIDTTSPQPPNIRVSATQVKLDEVVRFEFSATDGESGIDGGYYVKINNGLLLPTLSQLSIPFTARGEHTVTVRVFDRAGNFSESSQSIAVK